MIVKIASYNIADRKVVYLDTSKIWSFSFETNDKSVIFEANGKIIFKDLDVDTPEKIEFYFNQYENLKMFFTGEGLEYNANL